MILTDKELKELVITEPSKIKEAYTWWRKGEWNKINGGILIDPFETEKMGGCCYDLSVGDEYVSLRDPYNVKKLKEGEVINIEPFETVLILTREYIALPKNIMAMVVPRARWIFEGTFLNATRVDATWYGKLLVGFTNMTKWRISLGYNTVFCSCYFMRCPDVEKPLTKKDTPHLGRKTIDPLTFAYARPQRLLTPPEFTKEHLNAVVNSFGYPWDVIQCAIERGKDEIMLYIDKDVAPRMVEDATLKVTERAYRELLDLHKEHLKTERSLTKILMGFVITIAAGVISAILKFLGII
jgi:deoxycytidine triphosphate deaminase